MTKMNLCHFENWLKNWDATIQTYDGIEVYKMQVRRLEKQMRIIDNILAESDKNAMKGKDEVEAGKAIVENQNKKFYKELVECRNISQVMVFEIEKMNEMNFRKTKEIFRLNAELAKVKK